MTKKRIERKKLTRNRRQMFQEEKAKFASRGKNPTKVLEDEVKRCTGRH
jgi:hypothetical protein